MPYGPCMLCGATNYANSMGGSLICPSCDCGMPPHVGNPSLALPALAASWGFVMEPTEPNWSHTASIICGHDLVQKMNEDEQATFHSFVREVLRTTR